jgi:hypothetical protein
MNDSGVPEKQIDYYLGHLPTGGTKQTKIYAPDKAEHSREACIAIEAFMAEVRKHIKTANLDDPNALRMEEQGGRMANGRLTDHKLRDLHALIRARVGIVEICQRIGISSTLVYRHRKKLTGKTTA